MDHFNILSNRVKSLQVPPTALEMQPTPLVALGPPLRFVHTPSRHRGGLAAPETRRALTHLSVQAAPAWNTAPQPSPLLRPAMPLIPQGPNQRPLSSRVTFSPALGREFSSSKLALFVPPTERAPRSRLTCTDELGRRSSERLLRAEILTYPCLVITSKVRRREKKRWP